MKENSIPVGIKRGNRKKMRCEPEEGWEGRGKECAKKCKRKGRGGEEGLPVWLASMAEERGGGGGQNNGGLGISGGDRTQP
jgi:hypothetical protein